jgi:cell division protein FtsQ
MRFVPNRLNVEIHERTPVAFARVGPRISLIDAGGALMELPPKRKYSFPVILGMNPGEPLSTRAPRMKVYMELVRELDSGGASYSQDLSEVNLTDLEDVKVRVNDPAGDVLVHLGSSDYLRRYKTYAGHVQEWRQQFHDLESVDLRYDNQIVVNPDIQKPIKPSKAAPVAATMVTPVAVKPAALVTKIPSPGPHDKPLPKPVFEVPEKKLNPNATGSKKPVAKTNAKKPAAKSQAAASSKKAPSPGKPANSAMAKKMNSAVTHSRSQAHSAGPQKPSARKSSPPAHITQPAASSALPKPSPAIAKEQTNQVPN